MSTNNKINLSNIKIPGYDLKECIGEGAFGAVFKAEKDGKLFAIKILKSQSDSSGKFNLRKEATALACLNSPHIVHVHEFGEAGDKEYLVLDYVEGTTLTKHISKKLGEDQVIELAKQMTLGLREIHRRGMLHQDIKPDNFMVSNSWHLTFIDFGFMQNSDQSDSGTMAGSLLYAAPEQIGFLKSPKDNRSDLYSLGITLFECLTQTVPRRGNSISEMITQLNSNNVVDFTKYNANFRTIIPKIILKLIAIDPDDRYQSASGLLDDLNNIQELSDHSRNGVEFSLGAKDIKSGSLKFPLFGREDELNRISADWKNVQKQNSRYCQIEGEGGLGKSRLINEFLATVDQNETILFQGKANSKDTIPFGFIRQLLEDYSSQLLVANSDQTINIQSDIIKCAKRSYLSDFYISISFHRLLFADKPLDTRASYTPEQLTDVMVDFVLFLAEHKQIIIFIDDMQWVDQNSRNIFSKLIDKAAHTRIFIVSSARNDEASLPVVRDFLSQVEHKNPTRIELKPLNATAVSHLIQSFLSGGFDNKLTEKMMALSSGNPFSVIEYLRAMLESGQLKPMAGKWSIDETGLDKLALPKDVIELVVRRITKIPEQIKNHLRIAALIRIFNDEILMKIANVTEFDIAKTLEFGIRENLIERNSQGKFQFIHDRIVEAIISNTGATELKEFHEFVAKYLNAIESKTHDQIFDLAYHCDKSEHHELATRNYSAFSAAGLLALDQQEFKMAAEYIAKAIHIGEQKNLSDKEMITLLIGYCESLVQIDSQNLARAIINRCIMATENSAELNRIHQISLQSYYVCGQINEAWDEFNKILEELDQKMPEYEILKFLNFWWKFLTGFLFMFFDNIHVPAHISAKNKILCDVYLIGIRLSYAKSPKTCMEIAAEYGYFSQLTGDKNYKILGLSSVAFILSFLTPIWRYSSYLMEKALEESLVMGNKTVIAKIQANLSAIISNRGEFARCLAFHKHTKTHRVRYLDGAFRNLDLNAQAMNCMVTGDMKTVLQFPKSDIAIINQSSNHNASGYFNILYVANGLAKRNKENIEILQVCNEISDRYRYDPALAGSTMIIPCALWMEEEYLSPRIINVAEAIMGVLIKPARDEIYAERIAYPLLGYIAIRRIRMAKIEVEKKPLIKSLQEVIKLFDLKGNSISHQRAHYYNLKAFYASCMGNLENARALYEKALWYSEISNAPWPQYIVMLEFARFLLSVNEQQLARSLIRTAFQISLENEWLLRADNLQVEFPFLRNEQKSFATKHSGTSSTLASQDVQLRQRYVDSLIQVSLASTISTDSKTQVINVLDELITLMKAERAFIFFQNEQSEHLEFYCGRNNSKLSLTNTEDFSKTFVRKVAENKKPMVSTNSDIQGISASQSVVIHDLRSLMAAPLVLKNKFLGVIYLDSRMSKGLFTAIDAEILKAIAVQICIFFEMAKTLKLEKEKIQLTNELEIQTATAEMRKNIQALADNMRQSLFSISRDGQIIEPISKYSHTIFGKDIRGLNVREVLFHHLDKSMSLYLNLETALNTVFGEDDLQWSLMEDYFPKKIVFSNKENSEKNTQKTLKVSTAPIWDSQACLEKILFVVEDVTELEQLEKLMNAKQRQVNILQEIVTNNINDVMLFVDNCGHIVESLTNLTLVSIDKPKFDQVYRELHTLKGNARYLGLLTLSNFIHTVESTVTEMSLHGIEFLNLNKLHETMNTILAITKEYSEIAKKFLNVGIDNIDKHISIEKNKLDALIEASNLIFSNSSDKNLIPLYQSIAALHKKSVRKTLLSFSGLVEELAEKHGRTVNFDVLGDEVEFDKPMIDLLKDTVGHLIRNAIDHGIESTIERINLKKNPVGQITIEVHKSNNCTEVVVRDDGRGLNPELIGQSALKKGLVTQDQLDKMDSAKKVELIFAAGFSTRDIVTDTSGRGYGMDAVKTGIESISGSIHISSTIGMGSQFTLKFPDIESTQSFTRLPLAQ